jgi:hypothetical protein
LAFENRVISCFKRFSKVFDRLKPRLRVFSTSSLSRYSATFFLLVILRLHPRACEGVGGFFAISLMRALTR